MSDMPIYYASELNPDICLNIAMFLFETRRKNRLTITEAAAHTCLSVKDVDELETQTGQYDFAKIAKLLDLYRQKLPIPAICFRKISVVLTKKYFEG